MTAFTTCMAASLEILFCLSVKPHLTAIASYRPDVVVNDLEKHSVNPGAIYSLLQIFMMERFNSFYFESVKCIKYNISLKLVSRLLSKFLK